MEIPAGSSGKIILYEQAKRIYGLRLIRLTLPWFETDPVIDSYLFPIFLSIFLVSL